MNVCEHCGIAAALRVVHVTELVDSRFVGFRHVAERLAWVCVDEQACARRQRLVERTAG